MHGIADAAFDLNSMMLEMVERRDKPRLLTEYVQKLLKPDPGLKKKGKVADALKGSGVVQELASALERHRVLDYLPEIVAKVSHERLFVRRLVATPGESGRCCAAGHHDAANAARAFHPQPAGRRPGAGGGWCPQGGTT